MLGRKLSRAPNGANWIVTTLPPPLAEICGTGIRELPAGEELRRLAVERHQVGLGDDLGQAVLAQRVEEDRELAGVEDAEELRIRGREGRARRVKHRLDRLIEVDRLRPGAAKSGQEGCRLAAGGRGRDAPGAADGRADDVSIAHVEPVDADRADGGPVQLGDLDVEHHLPRAGDADPVDDEGRRPDPQAAGASSPSAARSSAPAPSSAAEHAPAAASASGRGLAPAKLGADELEDLGHRLHVGDLALEDDLRAGLADVHLGAGEDLLEPRLQVARVDGDADEEGRRPAPRVPDRHVGHAVRTAVEVQQPRVRLVVDQLDVGDGRVRDGDPRQRLPGLDQPGAADDDVDLGLGVADDLDEVTGLLGRGRHPGGSIGGAPGGARGWKPVESGRTSITRGAARAAGAVEPAVERHEQGRRRRRRGRGRDGLELPGAAGGQRIQRRGRHRRHPARAVLGRCGRDGGQGDRQGPREVGRRRPSSAVPGKFDSGHQENPFWRDGRARRPFPVARDGRPATVAAPPPVGSAGSGRAMRKKASSLPDRAA